MKGKLVSISLILCSLIILSEFANAQNKSDKNFEPVIFVSPAYLMPGDEVTITVGIWNNMESPVVYIDSMEFPINKSGYVQEKFIAQGSGIHTSRVVVNYWDAEGYRLAFTKDLEFIVGTPSGPAVMLDKLNVFYVGIDNPIRINSGKGMDRTNVVITGGTISKTDIPGRYIVRVKSPGVVKLIVQADTLISTFEYIGKILPDPTPYVAYANSVRGKIDKHTLLHDPYLRADLDRFDQEAKFKVERFTLCIIRSDSCFYREISNEGFWFNKDILNAINTLQNNDIIMFNKIYAKGPDSILRLLPPLVLTIADPKEIFERKD
jgi:hypothetical protein